MTADLASLVAAAEPEELPRLIGQLAEAQAAAMARLTAEAAQPKAAAPSSGLMTLRQAAAQCGMRVETLASLARRGLLQGAVEAPTRGRGKRRRWLIARAEVDAFREHQQCP